MLPNAPHRLPAPAAGAPPFFTLPCGRFWVRAPLQGSQVSAQTIEPAPTPEKSTPLGGRARVGAPLEPCSRQRETGTHPLGESSRSPDPRQPAKALSHVPSTRSPGSRAFGRTEHARAAGPRGCGAAGARLGARAAAQGRKGQGPGRHLRRGQLVPGALGCRRAAGGPADDVTAPVRGAGGPPFSPRFSPGARWGLPPPSFPSGPRSPPADPRRVPPSPPTHRPSSRSPPPLHPGRSQGFQLPGRRGEARAGAGRPLAAPWPGPRPPLAPKPRRREPRLAAGARPPAASRGLRTRSRGGKRARPPAGTRPCRYGRAGCAGAATLRGGRRRETALRCLHTETQCGGGRGGGGCVCVEGVWGCVV